MNLPASPSLDRLRRLARALQRACLAGEVVAADRLAAVFPAADPRALALTTAQTVIARDHGFPSWPALKAAVEGAAAPRPKSAAQLDAETLAEQWFALSDAEDLRPLNRALAIGKHRKEAARDEMRRAPARYLAFQRALVRGLGSRRERVRAECAHALDQFGDAWTRPALARLLDDPVPRVRRSAMHALSCHDCSEKPGALEPDIRESIIAAALGDPSPKVRFGAIASLGLAREHSAVPMLQGLLERETDAKLRRAAAWTLDQLTRPAKSVPAGV